MLVLEETSIDEMGAFLVYAPIELRAITSIANGGDATKVPILPSGIIISPDGRLSLNRDNTSNAHNGSILTVAFQILICGHNNPTSKQQQMEIVNEKGNKKICYLVSFSVAMSDLDSSPLPVVNDFIHNMVKIQVESVVLCHHEPCSTKNQCYKLHGYPRRKRGESHANGATTGGIHSIEAGVYDSSVNPNTISLMSPSTIPPAATSTPGTITALMYDVVNHNWIVDTCASNHMVHNLSLLNQHQDCSDQGHLKVNLPIGGQVSISPVGDSLVFQDKIVNDVLFILEFKYNLLFVSQFTKQLGCVVLFFPNLGIF
ncbi:hypothetical protein H5410_046961 [Solanum commersonii]|uniref:Uncharacterized protein n=1 Tax=Solanum commersonii TaxID=4109 RepID=A0A9J5XFV8_SOLCO|nr:hypothetical protein H5410_046961 [Solanum commersonii]